MKMNNIILWHGKRKLSIAQHYDDHGYPICQEILDITDDFDGDPVKFEETVESFDKALKKAMINSCLKAIQNSDVT